MPRFILPYLICSLGSILLFSDQAVAVRPAMSFSCSLPESMPYRLALEQIYTRAFANLGYDFSQKTYPVSRGLKMLEKGLVDGDCSRSATLPAGFKSSEIIKVDVLIRSTDYGIWSRSPELQITDIETLKKNNYRIGYSKGNLMVQQFLQKHHLTNVVAVEGVGNGLRMLGAKRFDVFLVGNGLVYEQKDSLSLRAAIYMNGILFTDQSYLYLHKKHENIRAALEVELKKIIPDKGIPVQHVHF